MIDEQILIRWLVATLCIYSNGNFDFVPIVDCQIKFLKLLTKFMLCSFSCRKLLSKIIH